MQGQRLPGPGIFAKFLRTNPCVGDVPGGGDGGGGTRYRSPQEGSMTKPMISTEPKIPSFLR